MDEYHSKSLLKLTPEEKHEGEDLGEGEGSAEQQTTSFFLLDPFEHVEGVRGPGRRPQGVPETCFGLPRVPAVSEGLKFDEEPVGDQEVVAVVNNQA